MHLLYFGWSWTVYREFWLDKDSRSQCQYANWRYAFYLICMSTINNDELESVSLVNFLAMMYLIYLEAGWESLSLCSFSLEAISPSSRLLDICMVDHFRAIGKLHHQKSMCPWLSSCVTASFVLSALKIIFWRGNKVYSSLVYIVVSFDADLRFLYCSITPMLHSLYIVLYVTREHLL